MRRRIDLPAFAAPGRNPPIDGLVETAGAIPPAAGERRREQQQQAGQRQDCRASNMRDLGQWLLLVRCAVLAATLLQCSERLQPFDLGAMSG
jgi:hypothetical protein